MKKWIHRFLSVALLFCMLCTLLPALTAQASAANTEIVSLNDASVFLKQSPRTCTLVSNLMMFRRGALINQNSKWDSFTEKNYKTKWWRSGMKFYPKGEGMSGAAYSVRSKGDIDLAAGDLNARRKYFIQELSKHPEGIVIYFYHGSKYQHAVLLTDYDSATNTFYCADPANSAPKGRIPLEKSILYGYVKDAGSAKSKWSKQDNVIAYVNQIWKIKSGINYCKHTNISYGKCMAKGCSYIYPSDSGQSYNTHGVYCVTGSGVNLKERPYADSSQTYCKTLVSNIPIGTELKVDYSVVNQLNHTWYHVVGCNGKNGYIYTNNIKYVRDLDGTISFSNNITQPENYTQSSSYSYNLVSGTITAKDTGISWVRGAFYRYSSEEDIEELYPTEKIMLNGAASYSINRASALNLKLKFGKLSAGVYRYGITACDVYGREFDWESDFFEVYEKQTPAQKICSLTFGEAQAVEGGNSATISSSTPGASITVTPTSAVQNNSGSSVTIFLSGSQTVAARVSASGYQATSGSKTYHVGVCSAPALELTETPDGIVATLLSASAESEIWYALDGGSFSRYERPLLLTDSQILQAYTKKAGCADSERIEQEIILKEPPAPVISSGALGTDVALGTSIAVNWPAIASASGYEVTVTINGQTQTQTVSEPCISFPADQIGQYTVSVCAMDNLGNYSESSNEIAITTHAPSAVRFVDYDGTLLTEQTVPYRSAAAAPSVPQRRGYTFSGWNVSFDNVLSDLTVTAQYEIKVYTVKFYNYDGETIIHTQRIPFDEPVDSDAACSYLPEKTGFRFTGWRITYADPESEMDIEHIDSNMSLLPVREWQTAELPVVIENVAATRDRDAKSYLVTYDLTTAPRAQLGGDTTGVKIIAVLKSLQADPATGETTPHVIALSVDQVMLQEDRQQLPGRSITVTLGNQGNTAKADIVEVYALALDGADRTGGALSTVATAVPTIDISWSEWSDELPAGIPSENVQTRIVYRYRDNTKQTNTIVTFREAQTELDGWIYNGSNEWWGSEYASDSALTESDSLRKVRDEQVKVTDAYTQYRYGRWTNGTNNSYCKKSGKNNYGGTWREEWTAWTNTAYKISSKDFYCSGGSSHGHTHVAYKDSYGDNWHPYTKSGTYSKAGRWFWEEKRTVAATYRTRYIYQDRYYDNYFYKWIDGNWSDWSVEPVTPVAGSRDVETKVQYAYITSDTTQTADTAGSAYTVEGNLDSTTDLSGKLATVLVYKTRNTDPTESQLEYVGQITLGAGNHFSLTFKNKEDPSEYTGDYTVALGLQGGSNLVNIDQIRYSANYTVTFTDGVGNILEKQTVSRGSDAVAPAAPDRPGYRFVKWDAHLTDIQNNMEVVPVWIPERYSVVFVDYVNQTVQMQNDIPAGSSLSFPVVEGKNGYVFQGWRVQEAASAAQAADTAQSPDSSVIVNSNLIAIADWAVQMYTVNFMDADGGILSTQEIAYGQTATPPESVTVDEGKVFLGWSTEFGWWSVTQDMNVYPLVAHKATTAAPSSNLEGITVGSKTLLVLTAEDGATIYYTTDGTDPDTEPSDSDSSNSSSKKYDGPFELTEDTTVKVIASKPDANESEIIEIEFLYSEEYEDDAEQTIIPLQTVNVMAKAGQTVQLRVGLDENPGLVCYQLVVQADPSVFAAECDENGQMQLVSTSGTGSFITAPYDSKLGGWSIFWYSTEPLKASELLTITLKTESDAEEGTYPITVGYVADNTLTDAYVSANLSEASMDLLGEDNRLLGDVNGDGKITALDVVRIARYLVNDGSFSQTEMKAADVNGDGVISAADVILLARFLIGLAELG